LIINNRPDGESDDQMSRRKSKRQPGAWHGLCPYSSGSGQISDEQITAMAEAIKQAGDGYISDMRTACVR